MDLDDCGDILFRHARPLPSSGQMSHGSRQGHRARPGWARRPYRAGAGGNDNGVTKQQKPELTEVPLDDPPEKLQPSEWGRRKTR